MSDHADWTGLLGAIDATGAERVLATHGQTGAMCRFLRERGVDADSLQTEYVGEHDDAEIDADDDRAESANDPVVAAEAER